MYQVFKRTFTETLRLPVRSTRAARELLFRQLTFPTIDFCQQGKYILFWTHNHIFFLCLKNYLFSEAQNTSFLRKYLFWLGRKNTLVCQPNVFRTGKEVVRCQTQNGDLAQTSFPRKLAKISEKTCKDFSEPGKANPWLWICVGNGMIFSKFVMKCYHKVRVTNKKHSDFLEKVYMLMLLNK